jgi:hypothetical protein
VLLFLLGGFWDVAWHIEVGRDTFWSPPHLLLYAGVLTILGASVTAFVAAWRRGGHRGPAGAGSGAWRRLPRASAVIAAIGGLLALAAGPLDDLWHRLYGLDVTIISPPHLLLVCGVAIATYGALAGFTARVVGAAPARGASLWPAPRPDARPWVRGETGLFAAGGLLLAVLVATLGEYDFDVARTPIWLHPVLLAGLSALALSLTARAGGRVGGATLAATAYTLFRLLAQLELILLTGARPQIPLLLLAAPVLDLALWGLSRRMPPRPWAAAPPAGALYGAALLLIQWPFTTAAGRVIWTPQVLLEASLPALAAGAAGALAGWALGACLRPLPATATAPPAPRPASRLEAPPPAPRPARPRKGAPSPSPRVATIWGPRLAIALAGAVLLAFWILPAASNAGALPRVDTRASARQEVVGTLALDPPAPIAGQPLTVQLTITDPFLISDQTLIPFQSVRAGDVQEGVLRAGTQPGLYQATFTPQEPGRRWISAYLQIEEQRTAASASFVVYPPGAAPQAAPSGYRSVVLRPEPGPDPTLPDALRPLAYLALGLLLGGAAATVYAALTRDRVPGPGRALGQY